MERPFRPAHLTSVFGPFAAKVLRARLQSEGIRTELRGYSEGPYPLQVEIGVYVAEEELDLAREILLADAVDAVFDESCRAPRPRRGGRLLRWRGGR